MAFYCHSYTSLDSLSSIPDWATLAHLPHFCDNACLKHAVELALGGACPHTLGTLSQLLDHPDLCGRWLSLDGELAQFHGLSHLLEDHFSQRDPFLYQTLYQQQGELLECLRLCLALGTATIPEALPWLSPVQQGFLTVLQQIYQDKPPEFCFLEGLSQETFYAICGNLFGTSCTCGGIVVHGVMSFSPELAGLLHRLHDLGVDIHFLFPQTDHNAPWVRLYEGFAPITTSTSACPTKAPRHPNFYQYQSPHHYQSALSHHGIHLTPVALPLAQKDTLLGHPLGRILVAFYQYYQQELGRQGLIEQCLSSPLVAPECRGDWLTLYHLAHPIFADGTDPHLWFAQVYPTHKDHVALEQLSIYDPQIAQLPPLLVAIAQWERWATTLMEDQLLVSTLEDILRYASCSQWRWVSYMESKLLTLFTEHLPQLEGSEPLADMVTHYQTSTTPPPVLKPLSHLLGLAFLSQQGAVADTCYLHNLSHHHLTPTFTQWLPQPLCPALFHALWSPHHVASALYTQSRNVAPSFYQWLITYALTTNLPLELDYCATNHRPPHFLTAMGITPTPKEMWDQKLITTPPPIPQQKTTGVGYHRFRFMTMFLCPYRFFLEEGLGGTHPITQIDNYGTYYENLVICKVWQLLSGMPLTRAKERLPRTVQQVSKDYQPYFPFWSQGDFVLLEHQVSQYITRSLMNPRLGRFVKEFAPSHMEMRQIFGTAYFTAHTTKHPYHAFEQLVQRRHGTRNYSLHALPKLNHLQKESPLIKGLQEEVKQYLNQSHAIDHQAICGPWCQGCPHQALCPAQLEL